MRQVVYQFGNFTVDTGAHALFKEKRRLSIQEQPFQVLLALLENPGQVVTRETLRVRLWGTDTFVDFDQSLNSALRRLRLALDDNSRDPVYVETIPRVGFRFLPEVVVDTEPSANTANDLFLEDGIAPAALTGSAKSLSAVVPTEAPRRTFPQVAGAVATFAFLLGVLAGALPSHWKWLSEPAGVAASSRDLRLARTENAAGIATAPPVRQAYPALSTSPRVADPVELEGWYHLDQRTEADYTQARRDFEQALAAKPQNAPAMVGLAQTEILMAMNGDAPGQRLPHARLLGQQALQAAPHLAAAHTVVGAADALMDWNDAEAEQEFATALHLNPHDSLTHLWYAVFVLMPRRDYGQAETEAMLAVQEDPLSLIAHTNLGWILYTEGKRGAALEQYSFVLKLKPDFVPARFRVIQLLRAKGQPHDAALKQVAALMPGSLSSDPVSPASTSEISPRCEQLPSPDADDPHVLSVLRVGVKEHCLQDFFVGQNPELSLLKQDSAFAELVKAAHPANPLR